MLQRLDKILASQGTASRSEIQKIIIGGFVSINGNICRKKDFKADPENDIIAVNGKQISFSKHTYIMLNKPKGVLSASEDKNCPTVTDLVPDSIKRKKLFPAGRLDKDTEGLIIITDDGDYAHRMLSPKNHVDKIYHAVIDGRVTEKEIEMFKNGIVFADGFKCLPAKLRVIENGEKQTCEVTVCEGKFHQVKKMFLAVGCTVLELKRVKIGGLPLDGSLAAGQCRVMTAEEYNKVFETE